jgi:enoyl-CoA hydratase/carnithine racemase
VIDERRDGAVTWLTFTRPEALNAFTIAGYRDLRIALQRLASDEDTRVVVLTGSGRAFSVGADRSLLQGPLPEDQRRYGGEEFAALLDSLSTFEKPLFAAVNGLSVGLGATMLLYCDVILLAETARLRMPFTALGLVPEAGSSALLPARVRWADAMWAMLSSEWIDATAAYEMGLAWRVVPDGDLLSETAAAAAVLASLDPKSVGATKRLLIEGRREVAQKANDREMVEMRALLGRREID